MALPAAIQRQLDEAERIESLMAGETDTPDTPNPTEPEQPPVEPANQAPEAPVTQEPEIDWKQRFQTIDGKYTAEVPRLQNELSDKQSQINEMRVEIDKLKKKLKKPQMDPESKPREIAEDEELVGADIVKAAERAAQRAIKDIQLKLEEIQEENSELKQKLGQVSESQTSFAGNDFFSKLSSVVPDWQALQESDKGQQFLLSRITGTEITWDAALKAAASRLDVGSTVEIFDEIVRRYPELRPAKAKPAKENLAKQVSPNKSKAAASPTDAQKVWSHQELTAAWDSISKRLVKGEEADKLQAELEAAMQEDRVR